LKQNEEELTLKSLYSISIAYLSLYDLKVAEEIMLIVYEEAQKNKLKTGSIGNALGVFALHRKDYETAAKYFKQSMDLNQRINRGIGEYNSGLNLLLTYTFSNNIYMSNRLVKRVERLGVLQNNSDRMKYFELIEVLAKVVKNGPLNQAEKVEAQEKIDTIASEFIKTAVNDFISPSLGIAVKPTSKIKKEVPEWMLAALDDMQCSKEAITPSVLKQSLKKDKK
jgi:hypothetical protein